jgi:hypothetical protein
MSLDKTAFFARTMHTPDSPERAELRDALREISAALIALHRLLIDAARSDYNFAYGSVGAAQLVELIRSDPFFGWLQPLTSIIVDIDEMRRTDFETREASSIAERLDRLFGAGERDPLFAGRYVEILQRDVAVAMAHAQLRRALQRLAR